MKRPIAVLLGGALLLAVVSAAPAASAVRFRLPEPTGPYPVGVTDLRLVDQSRQDPWVPGTRELMITIRYPALPGGQPRAPFLGPGAAAAVAVDDAVILGVDAASLDYTFPTHSRVDAAAIGGHRPVVLYSPGAERSRAAATAQQEQLASLGYVVVAVDHTHEAVAVEFPGGRVEHGALPSQSPEVGKQMIATRVQDTSFVLDQLGILARGGNPDGSHRPLPIGLGRSLDLSRIGMFGHSAGGFTSGETMVSDRRIDAGADLDGSMAYSQGDRDFGRVADEGLDRPFLLMSAGNHSSRTDASWQEFLANQRGWHLRLHLPAARHFSYTDYQAMVPQLGLDPVVTEPVIGTVDPARSVAAQRAYVTAFFDEHLRGREQALLDGPSPKHPDVEFGT